MARANILTGEHHRLPGAEEEVRVKPGQAVQTAKPIQQGEGEKVRPIKQAETGRGQQTQGGGNSCKTARAD